jgi:hypothetical protein
MYDFTGAAILEIWMMAALKHRYSQFDYNKLLRPADRVAKKMSLIQPPHLMRMVE